MESGPVFGEDKETLEDSGGQLERKNGRLSFSTLGDDILAVSAYNAEVPVLMGIAGQDNLAGEARRGVIAHGHCFEPNISLSQA